MLALLVIYYEIETVIRRSVSLTSIAIGNPDTHRAVGGIHRELEEETNVNTPSGVTLHLRLVTTQSQFGNRHLFRYVTELNVITSSDCEHLRTLLMPPLLATCYVPC